MIVSIKTTTIKSLGEVSLPSCVLISKEEHFLQVRVDASIEHLLDVKTIMSEIAFVLTFNGIHNTIVNNNIVVDNKKLYEMLQIIKVENYDGVSKWHILQEVEEKQNFNTGEMTMEEIKKRLTQEK